MLLAVVRHLHTAVCQEIEILLGTLRIQPFILHVKSAICDWCNICAKWIHFHHIDVIMTTMASQITSLMVVYSVVYSGADQRKHQSSASQALCGEFTGTGELPAQKASNAENVSIWWRQHVCCTFSYQPFFKAIDVDLEYSLFTQTALQQWMSMIENCASDNSGCCSEKRIWGTKLEFLKLWFANFQKILLPTDCELSTSSHVNTIFCSLTYFGKMYLTDVLKM